MRALLVVALVVAGCTKPPAVSRLVLATTAEPDSLCALASESAPAQELIALLSRELVVDNPEWQPVPDLAAAMPDAKLVGGKLEVTWKIRDDARWEDGTPVTAADFVRGHELDERAEAKRVESLVASADGRSFTVTWAEPNPFYAVTRVHRAVPAKVTGPLRDSPYCRRPLSNGPFVLAEWVPGQHLLFKRNEHYAPRPKLDEILVKIVPSTSAILTMLEAGDVDAAFPSGGPSPLEAKSFADAHPGFAVEKAPGQIWAHIDLNVDDPALKDVAVRRALAEALPRQKLVDAVSHGLYEVADGYLPKRHWGYTPTAPLPFDPAAARAVLEPLKLKLVLSSASGQPEAEQLLLLVKQAWREAGVDVELDLRPFKVFFGENARKRKTQLAFYSWTVDGSSMGTNLWRKDRIPSEENGFKGQNFPGWRNDEATALLERADATLDVAARKAMLARVQALLTEEMPAIPMYFRPAVALHNARVSGLQPTGTLTPLAWNAAQWAVR